MADNTSVEQSAASQLLQQHSQQSVEQAVPHPVTVEEVVDEELPKPVATESSTAAPAAKPKASQAPSLSTEVFPELGAAPAPNRGVAGFWAVRQGVNGKANGTSSANGTPAASAPSSAPPSGVSTPTPPAAQAVPSLSIPGRNIEYTLLEPQHVLPRAQLKRPLPDIAKDFNRRSRAPIKVISLPDGKVRVEATGAQEVATQALKDFINQIGTKLSIKVSIPRSTRAHIIGKGGSTIKSLQEKTGARIQMPKVDESQAPVDEDDDSSIDVFIEGNAQQAAAARNAVLKIAGERAGNTNTRVKGIPAEFYPFIAKNGLIGSLQHDKGVQVQVPTYQAWSAQPPSAPAPGQRPVFHPAADNFIQLVGEREAVKSAREEIERRAQQLREQLQIEQFPVNRGRHQFIIGERGIPLDQFFDDTGCTIVMPTDEEDDLVTIIGPADNVQTAAERAMDLAMNMQSSNIDLSRFYRQAPGGAAAHARNVTRYLRERREIERLEKLHNVHFNTPFSTEGALPWELYARDGKNAIRAQSEIKGLADAHPPSRIATVAVDPFFHSYIQKEVRPRVRQDYGVHVVVPRDTEAGAPVLFVYEGRAASPDSYEVPRSQPSQAELLEMQKWLREAQAHLEGLINQQEAITSTTLEVPHKYHDKLRKFIKKEQENRASNQIPTRVSNIGTSIIIRGPASAVQSLAAKCEAFVEQEKEDEKERGFTLEFDFPQKFANHLIGKGGSNIRDLRDKFDVDIQVNDGKVLLKGPKAKAEAAKTHIGTLGRQLQDEATHILKIDPKFHRELIGAQGAQINRLQTRYKVIINFPRTAKPAKDDESVAESASDAGKPRRQQAADEVIVRGPKRGADEARDEILSLLQYLKDHSFSATLTVQQKQLPSLIGSGGAVLEQLRQQTGARIDIPKESGETQVEIQIKGTKTQVADAKKLLEEKKAVFDDTVVKTIEVDRKYHKALIGTGGANLRDIVVKAGGSDDRRELARAIQFPKQDTDGNTIKVEGRSQVVDKIVAQIQAVVAERESQVSEVVEVPVEKHRSLIGRGGDVKRNLEAQFKVSIDIPRQGSSQTGVKIVGQSADVEKAKAHIEDLIKEQPGETIQIPRALHHAVSSNGQIFRRLRNDYHVSVDHAGHAIPPRPTAPTNARANGGALPLITDDEDKVADAHSWRVVVNETTEEGDIPWVLRGSPENIEKAKKAIETALEQGKKQDATGYLILPDPKTYRYVIGQGGSKVTAIRKQSGCRITVPRDQAKDEAIEIVGSKEGVEKAKELILAAVQEGVNSRPQRGERDY
ncbi:vigilin 1 [Cladorrhinum sp. PSN332]|nr:vigilin 1 [Cladorrhinum sp. PSN332]